VLVVALVAPLGWFCGWVVGRVVTQLIPGLADRGVPVVGLRAAGGRVVLA